MGKLTDAQRLTLRGYLLSQGLSFKPLQDEMVDHLSCDLEDRMGEGQSFEMAWHQTMSEIPENHFQIIQTEIMETINKRFSLTQGLSILALTFLFISVIFKVFHLQGGDFTLLASFGLMAVSLLTASLTGISINRERKGSARVLGVICGVIILLIAFAFKLMHWPGADQLIVLAEAVLMVSLIANTLYVYKHASGEGNLLTFLHEKHTPGIERFFLFLLMPLAIYKTIFILSGSTDFIGNFILLVVLFGAGLQFIALCWRAAEKDPLKCNAFTLAATIVSFSCSTLVFLGPILPLPIRIVMIAVYSVVSAWLAITMEEKPVPLAARMMAVLVPAVFLGWALIRLGALPFSAHSIFFNLPLLAILLIGLFLCRKHGPMRAYMIVSAGSYLFEYIM
jgi:hypothetical protein